MTEAGTLALTRLDDFASWCESNGWTREPPKGIYEVLRLVPQSTVGLRPMVFYRRDRGGHVHASYGTGTLEARWVQKWLRQRAEREGKETTR